MISRGDKRKGSGAEGNVAERRVLWKFSKERFLRRV